jgi:hypothetical protein
MNRPCALLAVLLVFAACDHNPDPYADDNPEQGAMGRATADRVFSWGTVSAGVEIRKFRSASALKDYLTGSSRQSSPAASALVLSRVDGKPVVRVSALAFSPAVPGGVDDISTVVTAVTLPETIERLGTNLFAKVRTPVTVTIPSAVADAIPLAELYAAAGDRATIQKVNPVNPAASPVVIVQGPPAGSSPGGEAPAGGNDSTSGNNAPGGSGQPQLPSPPPAPALRLGDPVVTYAGDYSLSAAFTFDRAVTLVSHSPDWRVTESGAAITAVPETQIPGTPLSFTVTVANPQAPERTTTVTETFMPVSGVFTPTAGLVPSIRYADRHGALGLDTGWYYIADPDIRRLFNAVYTPNAPQNQDSIGDGISAVPYTPELSAQVLDLFHIILGASRDQDRVELTGASLPRPANASAGNQLVIDIGLSGEDNTGLPVFVIPDRGLGTPPSTTTTVYDYLRFRVNRGARLVIQADNSGYISNGDACPAGNVRGATVDVMPRGKLRLGAYDGEPLGEEVTIVARNGSALAMGPESSFGPGSPGYDADRDRWYQGWLIGPREDDPRILWDGGDQTGNYLELRGNRMAFSASITVRKNVRLGWPVWFVSGPTLTINVSGTETEDGKKGVFSGRDGVKFYGTASSSGGYNPGSPAATILIRPGNTLAASFVSTGTGFITAGSAVREILNGGGAGELHYYRQSPPPIIGGYFDWK